MNFRDYPVEELRVLSQRAGVASGKARREKRAAIEREKIENVALREQHRENLETIRSAVTLLLECKKTLDRSRYYDEQ